MKTLRLHKFIAITLCVTLLTVSASRVTRVSAVATVTAVAGAATLAVGIGFLSYCALTGMAIHCPNTVADLRDWFTSVGQKVIQYPSGRAAYDELYPQMINEPLTDILDHTWDWTTDKILAFANDFADTRIISNIVGYWEPVEAGAATNGFDYVFPLVNIPNVDTGNQPVDSSWIYTGPQLVYGEYQDTYYLAHTTSGTYRNLLLTSDEYVVQQLVNGTWVTVHQLVTGGQEPNNGRYLNTYNTGHGFCYNISWYGPSSLTYTASVKPLLPYEVIHDEATDTDLPMIVPEDTFVGPSWPDVLDPDDEVEYPIVPYVEYPVDVYGGGQNPNPRWGFNIEDLLDILADLGEAIFDLTVLRELLNRFAGDHSGDTYIYYDYSENGTTYNNYNYFTNVNYGDDYVTYNIDVSHVDEELPVDLNTIQLYTNNRYLDEVKRSAIAGSSIIRDLVVFVYDIDPGIVYVFFGSCIAILLAAFIGKWGHS